MRAVISPDGGGYPYAGTSYADPDAVTQIANGLSTTTFTYDNNGNVTQKTTDGTTTIVRDGLAISRVDEEFLAILREPPPWADGLPLSGKVHSGPHYLEAPKEPAKPLAMPESEETPRPPHGSVLAAFGSPRRRWPTAFPGS